MEPCLTYAVASMPVVRALGQARRSCAALPEGAGEWVRSTSRRTGTLAGAFIGDIIGDNVERGQPTCKSTHEFVMHNDQSKCLLVSVLVMFHW